MKGIKEREKLVDCHFRPSVLRCARLFKNLIERLVNVHLCLCAILSHLSLTLPPRPPIAAEHLLDSLCLKIRAHGFIASREHDARQAVKLFESYGRRRIVGDDADDGRLDVRWRAEGIARDFEDVVDLGVQLRVDGEAAVRATQRGGAGSERRSKPTRGLRSAEGGGGSVACSWNSPIPQIVARACDEAQRKFALEHEDAHAG